LNRNIKAKIFLKYTQNATPEHADSTLLKL